MFKTMKNIVLCFLILLALPASAEKTMGTEAPGCVGKEVKTQAEAKCIALFFGKFISTVGAFGAEWDVTARRHGDEWFVYPKKANSLVSLDTLLYKINAKTGKPSEFRPKT